MTLVVRVRFTADDPTWLRAAAGRHGGEVSNHMLTSYPGQQDVFFHGRIGDAKAFVEELASDGRYECVFITEAPAPPTGHPVGGPLSDR